MNMPTATTVVTSARFDQGLTYKDFLAAATVNRDKFEQNYENPVLTEDDLAFFRKSSELPDGPRKLLAIAEAWCGDVYRELPSAVRIAESAGMDVRVFLRDENPDIMDEFLSNNGKSRAIPVFVFYTADTKYIAHFTERSASAHVGLALAMGQAKAKLGLPPSASFGNPSESGATSVSSGSDIEDSAAYRSMAKRCNQRDTSTVGDRPAPAERFGMMRGESVKDQSVIPIVYTIRGCDSCVKLLKKWDAEGRVYDERRVELSQATLDEARRYGQLVPIVVWPDGRVEQGFGDSIGCFI